MSCDIKLSWIDGSKFLYVNEDLDYWSIRQWRKVYCHLFKLQHDEPFKYYKLEIIPSKKPLF